MVHDDVVCADQAERGLVCVVGPLTADLAVQFGDDEPPTTLTFPPAAVAVLGQSTVSNRFTPRERG
ncbi:hypothetical protein AB0H92_48620 [Streptomyces phaeochromogenes]|uniref:hypothetical protein n=1 Tax=Streptomyces phaeochromogenes TaxID=1923 RepID=UPI0033DB262B